MARYPPATRPCPSPACPQRRPQRAAVLRGRVELPAELAGERHPQRAHRDVADGDLLRGHERERGVGQVRAGQLRAARRGCAAPTARSVTSWPVTSSTRTVGLAPAGLPAQPGRVVRAERGAGDHQERVGGQPGHGEVRLDAAARVERLRVGDVADVARDLVVADPLQKAAASGAGDLILANDDSSNSAGRLAGRRVLDADRPATSSRPAQPRGRTDSSPAAALLS